MYSNPVTLKSSLRVTQGPRSLKNGTIRKLGVWLFLFAFHIVLKYDVRYLVSFTRYSDLLVENREIFIPNLFKVIENGAVR